MNYSKFYALFNKVNWANKEELKKSLVSQYSKGRTESLRELTAKEYQSLCSKLEDMTGERAKIKAARSRVLKQMQQMGIDTTNWQRVDLLCEHKRLAGKAFRFLNISELDLLFRKLKSIQNHGGLKPKTADSCSFVITPIYNEIIN